MDSSTFTLQTDPFQGFSLRSVWLFFINIMLFVCFFKSVFIANSVDPDQPPRSAASDLGLHCFADVFLWDASS